MSLYLSTLIWQDPETWGALARRRPKSDGSSVRDCSTGWQRAEGWIALLTLTVLEIVLGIDNIVFISILAGKLPPEQRERARQARACRWRWSSASLLLLSITWVMGLTAPLVHACSARRSPAAT